MTETNQTAVSEKKAERELIYVPMGENDPVTLTVGQVKRFLSPATRSGAKPSDEQIIQFMMLCQARQLNPWVGDAFLVGFDSKDGPQFQLITAIQALLKRAETHPAFDGMEHGVIVSSGSEILFRDGTFTMPNEVLLGGWATVFRKDRSRPERSTVKIETYHTHRSRWEADPAGMIEKVALAAALRRAFPSQTGGLYLQEEFDDSDSGPQQAGPARPARGLDAVTSRLQSKHGLPSPVMDVPSKALQDSPAASPAKDAPRQATEVEPAPAPKKRASKATGARMDFAGPEVSTAESKPKPKAAAKPAATPKPAAKPEPKPEPIPEAVLDDEEPELVEEVEPELAEEPELVEEPAEGQSGDPLDVDWQFLCKTPLQVGNPDQDLAEEFRDFLRKVIANPDLPVEGKAGKVASAFANVMTECDSPWGVDAIKKLRQIALDQIAGF